MKNIIPKTLDESFEVLKAWATPGQLDKIKLSPEEDMIEFHSTVGRTIRNEWGFWTADSDLFLWFKSLGITHSDDMSGIILTSFYRHLNNLPLDLEGQIKHYQDFWKNEHSNCS